MPLRPSILAATALILALPCCSLLIDTNPDGVIDKTGAAGSTSPMTSNVSAGAGNGSGAPGKTTDYGAGGTLIANATSAGGGGGTSGAGALVGLGGVAATTGNFTVAGMASLVGSAAMGGSSAQSGGAVNGTNVTLTGGAVGAAGSTTIPSAGSVQTGGNRSNGGSGATAVTVAIGGALVAGGGAATGGAATGGVPSSGGTSGCGDTQSSPDNCGTCGHNCLGGKCLGGLCQLAIVVSHDKNLRGLNIIGMDDEYIYYSQPFDNSTPNTYVSRVRKDANSGSASQLMTHSCGAQFAITTTNLYYAIYPCGPGSPMSEPMELYSCSKSDCSLPVNKSWTPRLVQSFTQTTYLATTDRACDAPLCVNWWTSDGQSAFTYRSTDWMPPVVANSQEHFDAVAYRNTVFWVQELYDQWNSSIGTCLLSVDNVSLSRAQLAGKLEQIGPRVFLVDANARSVILQDFDTNILYRVPLPLGLGNNPPQPLGIEGAFATEDATGLYWIDQGGTLSHCAPPNCVATQTVLANSQGSGARLALDDSAIYWGRANPPAIMRLAK